MKKYTELLLLSVFVMLLLNCTKEKEKYTVEEINGVKYYKNTGEPTGSYRPSAKLLFEIKGPENVPDSIKGFGSIAEIVTDENDNIYILDGVHAIIKKYNRSGQFERYFPDQTGDRIDCFEKPNQMAILGDTLIVFDSGPSKYVRYLTNGEHLNSQLLFMGNNRPVNLKADGINLLTAFVPSKKTLDSIPFITNDLCIITNHFKVDKIAKMIREPYNENFYFPNILTSYVVKNDMLYIAENKGTDYKIYAMNGRGKLKYVTEKDYEKAQYNSYEISILNDFIALSGFAPVDTNKVYFKKPINSIEIDKKDQLWVLPSMNRTQANQDSFYIDIFKDGVFINRTVLDFVSGNEIFKLIRDRLYIISEDGKTLKVYDYQ